MIINKKEIFTIPNCLSYIRILLLPVFVYIYLTATDAKDYYIAGAIILISAVTDLLDGWIARTFNQITELGKAIDPFADKLQQAAIAFCLIFTYDYMWIIALLFVIKELFMGINGLILLRKGKKLDGAEWFGKLSTAVFYITTIALIIVPNMNEYVASLLITFAGFFLALSFLLYIPVYIKLYNS